MFLIIICFPLSLPLLPYLILNLKTFQICLSKGSCSRASCARFDFPPSHLLHQRAKVGLRCRQDVDLPESEQSPGPSCSSSQPRGEAGQRGTESFRLQKTSNIIESPDTIALRLFRSTPDVWWICMTVEGWLIIYLGLPYSLPMRNSICLLIAWIHYVVEKNLKILLLKFSFCLRWMSFWDFCLIVIYKNRTIFAGFWVEPFQIKT